MILGNTTEAVNQKLIYNYFASLVNSFFKILPIRESEEKSLVVYVESLQAELKGCGQLVEGINCDAGFMTLLATLQHLIDNPEYPVKKVKREVFKAISVCNRLKEQYGVVGGDEETGGEAV